MPMFLLSDRLKLNAVRWLCLTTVTLTCVARAQQQPVPDSSASIAQEIRELKEGQQRLLKELEEIKALLQDRPRRSEFPTKPLPPQAISLSVHGEIFRGDAQARIAIMEYSDFDCSYCSKYVTEIYPKIETNYVRTGKIKYFFRDLPASEHTNSLFKAQVARCAGEQGKFWEAHDRLFAEPSARTSEAILELVQTLGIDTVQLGECLAGKRYLDNIERSAAGAHRMGLHGTPAFLIGTLTEDGDILRPAKILVGAEGYQSFEWILNDLINTRETTPKNEPK